MPNFSWLLTRPAVKSKRFAPTETVSRKVQIQSWRGTKPQIGLAQSLRRPSFLIGKHEIRQVYHTSSFAFEHATSFPLKPIAACVLLE